MPFDNLEKLLQQYYIDLAHDADLEIKPNPLVKSDLVLMAIEEMLGIDGGGYKLGTALEDWLSQPAGIRQKKNFDELQANWEAEDMEMAKLVEEDMKEMFP